ncbi:hypothetical protein VPHD51_0104 [Vibrio phage D51]
MLVAVPICEPICKSLVEPLVIGAVNEEDNIFEVYTTLDVYDNLEVFS